MTSKGDTANNIRYIVPMAFYFFWIQCMLWADRLITAATAGNGNISANTSVFYFSHAAGCLIFAWVIGRIDGINGPLRMKLIRLTILLSVLLASLFSVFAAYAAGPLLMASICLTGFFSAPLIVVIQNGIQNEVNLKKRGSVLGKAFGSALLVNFVLFILLTPGSGGRSSAYTREYAVSQIYLAAVVFAAAGIAVFISICLKPPAKDVVTKPAGAVVSIKPRLVLMIAFVCLLFYSNIGIQDCVVSFSWFSGGNAMFLTKLFSIIGAFAAGFICDRKGRHLPILIGYGLLSAGIAAMMFSFRGVWAFIGFSTVQLAYMAFDISIKLVLLDIAVYSRKPLMITILGFALPYISKPAGTLAGELLQQFGPIPVFAVLAMLVSASAPFLSTVFEEIRRLYLKSIRGISHQPQLAYTDDTAAYCIPAAYQPAISEIDAAAIFQPDSSHPEMQGKTGGTAIPKSGISHPEQSEKNGSIVIPPKSSSFRSSSIYTAYEDRSPVENTGKAYNETLLQKPVDYAAEQAAIIYGLTAREGQVLQLVLLGQSVSEMAQNLFISEITVKTHISRILKKAGTKNRTQLLSKIYNMDKNGAAGMHSAAPIIPVD